MTHATEMALTLWRTNKSDNFSHKYEQLVAAGDFNAPALSEIDYIIAVEKSNPMRYESEGERL